MKKELKEKALYFSITRMKSGATMEEFLKEWKKSYPKESPFKK